jgi:predicted transcriptional regulator
MAKKRDRLAVIFDILKAVQDSGNKIKPTRLMHSSNLSPQMFDEYLDELIAKGFLSIHEESGKKHYSLEKKGFQFLEEYKVIVRFIDNFGL